MQEHDELAAMRQNYQKAVLEEEKVDKNPIIQFETWLNEAIQSQIYEANAMTLATTGKDMLPALRTVLLKGFDEKGFVFFTNYNSDKGQDIAENPNVSILFFWKELERQVRITGKAEKLEKSKSEAYFHSRPKDSQIGAWASAQSSVVENRIELENNFSAIKEQYKNVDKLPLPTFWGGYVVAPIVIEFWQGRPSRLHDRLKYTLQSDNTWKIERLAP